MSGWVLAIDFGTTNTAAAGYRLDRPDRLQELKLSSTATVMPSGVLRTEEGSLLTGETARHAMGALPPGSYEATPKRRLGEDSVVLGGAVVETVDVVAAVLRSVLERTAKMFNGTLPSQVRLTHPAVWADSRRQSLLAAAERAGLPNPMLVSEPVAAATYYAHQHPTGIDGPVAVYDLGGGTLDVAVLVGAGNGQFDVLATDGADPLGGELFDEYLLEFVREQLEQRGRGDLLDRLHGDRGGAWRTLLDSVRNAKHTLSELPSADIAVAVADDFEVLRITRGEFTDRIAGGLDRSVRALRSVLDQAALSAHELAALYLVGGSSFIPAVAATISRELRITAATFDDPKTVTSMGALLVPHATEGQRSGGSQHGGDHGGPQPSERRDSADPGPGPIGNSTPDHAGPAQDAEGARVSAQGRRLPRRSGRRVDPLIVGSSAVGCLGWVLSATVVDGLAGGTIMLVIGLIAVTIATATTRAATPGHRAAATAVMGAIGLLALVGGVSALGGPRCVFAVCSDEFGQMRSALVLGTVAYGASGGAALLRLRNERRSQG